MVKTLRQIITAAGSGRLPIPPLSFWRAGELERALFV
jgi:hypothetical protein